MSARLLLISLIAASLAACTKNYDEMMDRHLDSMKEMVSTLESVKDKKSAEAALEELESLAKALKRSQDEGLKLGQPSEETDARLHEKYDARLKELKSSLRQAMEATKPHLESLGEERLKEFKKAWNKTEVR